MILLCFWDHQANESEHINLKVLGQDNAVVQFKIKKHTPLRKLMGAYCERAVSTPVIYVSRTLGVFIALFFFILQRFALFFLQMYGVSDAVIVCLFFLIIIYLIIV